MNNGAATSGNEFIACAIFCGTIDARQSAEQDERERRQSHRREQREPEQDGRQPDADDFQHQVVHRPSARTRVAAATRRCASVSTTSLAPCTEVTTPASTMGTYIHAMEIGIDVASRS